LALGHASVRSGSTEGVYSLLVTLIIGMSKPEGIYLSVDYRVMKGGVRKDDDYIKHLTIHYPPLDKGGPKVLLGFTGMAELRDGMPTLTWIRETVRGEVEVIDQSMAHLRERLNRDIAPQRELLIINLLVLEPYRRLFGAFTNGRFVSGRITVMPKFQYVMHVLNDWTIFANGSGAQRLVNDGHLVRLTPHLGVVPKDPVNHMNLLAGINRQVAAKENSVSPFCNVSFIPSGDRFQPTSRSFTEPGETVPFAMPLILAGLDTTSMTTEFMRSSEAFFKGETSDLKFGEDKLNKDIKRRP
jgi:hypothetical protein